MKLKIYTVGHLPLDDNFVLPENYYYYKVGNNDFKADIYDNTLDNIAYKNPYYCELTAYYWILKNDKDSDVVGICHYRRYFSKTYLSVKPKYYLTKKDIEKYLKNHDIITTRLYKFNTDLFTKRCEFTPKEDIIKLRQSILNTHPEYIETYDKVINDNKTFLLNMIICKKVLFDKYATFLFDIFTDLEKYVDPTYYEGNFKRIYGYLSEFLLTVYVFHNNLKYKSCKVITTNIPFYKKLIAKIKRKFSD